MVPQKSFRPRNALFVGPADCNKQFVFRESGNCQHMLAQVLKQVVVTVAVVTVCWSYELCPE